MTGKVRGLGDRGWGSGQGRALLGEGGQTDLKGMQELMGLQPVERPRQRAQPVQKSEASGDKSSQSGRHT